MDVIYETVFPPKEIFLNEDAATWDWDKKGTAAKIKFRMLNEGLEFIPENGNIYDGFLFSQATQAVEIYKHLLFIRLRQLKNPLRWLFLKSTLQELDEMAYRVLRRYYLKPQYYCRMVREVFRILKLVGVKETRIHDVCSILQWDNAYRGRVQFAISAVGPQETPLKIAQNALRFIEKAETDIRMRRKWKALKIAFYCAYFIPMIRYKIRAAFSSLKFDEFRLTKGDIYYSFK